MTNSPRLISPHTCPRFFRRQARCRKYKFTRGIFSCSLQTATSTTHNTCVFQAIIAIGISILTSFTKRLFPHVWQTNQDSMVIIAFDKNVTFVCRSVIASHSPFASGNMKEAILTVRVPKPTLMMSYCKRKH